MHVLGEVASAETIPSADILPVAVSARCRAGCPNGPSGCNPPGEREARRSAIIKRSAGAEIMSSAPLSQKFGLQAVTGEYAGAETVLHFGSVDEELNVLRHGCGVFDLGWRGKLVVSGEDRVRWLNGMVSNNTRDLPQDAGNYSFVLNAQGHIQGDLLVFQRGEFYVLESEMGEIVGIREFLDRFIIMDDVEIGDISEKLTSIGVSGPLALQVLQSAGLLTVALKPGQLLDGHWNGHGFTLVRDPVAVRNWYELWLAPANVEAFWNLLLSSGAAPVGAEALEWQRILLGLPRVGVDTGARELAQETGQDYALHYAKGCYIGQEIVERIRARGQVHRRFTGLLLEGGVATRGSKVMAGEKEIGRITSSAEIMVEGVARSVALGYVKRSSAEPGVSLHVDGYAASITELPFQF
jgi:folate-binding protein YgfZ